MDIHRVDVVDVVLDFAENPLELGNEAIQKLQVVHELQGFTQPLFTPEDIEKRGIDFPVSTEPVVYLIEASPDQRFDFDMQSNAVLLSIFEDLHQPGGILFDNRLVGNYQFPLEHVKAL